MLKSSVKTYEGYEEIEAFTSDEVTLSKVTFSHMQRNKMLYEYCDEYTVLDTETSHDADRAGWVYQWAFKFNGIYIYGRTPEEFIALLERMRDFYNLNRKKRIIIYVHNLQYDLQYLKHYLAAYDEKIHIMAIDNHTMLICDVFGFRFLCSYKMSNMSLDMFSKNYADHYRKAVGDINYNVVRYQDSELTETDWQYMFSDVASQHEAIAGYLKTNGYDKAYKAPFTSTGFVRVDCRHAAEKSNRWRARFSRSRLDSEQYALCRQAFMGGITIASWMYAGQCVDNVGHKDFTSSYPARQMMDYFPEGAPTWYGSVDSKDELDFLLSEYCCVFLLTMEDVHIKAGITAPYIPSSKCVHIENELKLNGKVVSAANLSIVVTELDYKWIARQYDANAIKIDKMLIFNRGTAPTWLKNQIMKYYKNKCELKHSDPRLYMASKALLNAIYGMSATALVRDQYELDDNYIITSKRVKNGTEDAAKQLEKYYNSYNSFMPYQYGVWTTAHARDALMEMIEAVGYENFIYCDTDSVFYIKSEEVEKRLDEMNAQIAARATEAGAYIGDNILGLATDEAPIRRFKALHAKCYACEELEKDGEYHLHVTIAGIPKKSIKWLNGQPVTMTNAEELGSIEALEDGFTFRHNGGTRCLYIEQGIRHEYINGHYTSYASSAIIENIEKTISDTMYTIGEDYELLHINQRQTL